MRRMKRPCSTNPQPGQLTESPFYRPIPSAKSHVSLRRMNLERSAVATGGFESWSFGCSVKTFGSRNSTGAPFSGSPTCHK